MHTDTYYRICFTVETPEFECEGREIRYTDLAQAQRDVPLLERLAKERCRLRKVSVWRWAEADAAHLVGDEACDTYDTLLADYESWFSYIENHIGYDNRLSHDGKTFEIERVTTTVKVVIVS